jgi:hypothetical protein
LFPSLGVSLSAATGGAAGKDRRFYRRFPGHQRLSCSEFNSARDDSSGELTAEIEPSFCDREISDANVVDRCT